MPIEITIPTTGALFGPGAPFVVHDTTVGPFPVDDEVHFELFPQGAETPWGGSTSLDASLNSWVDDWLMPIRIGWVLPDDNRLVEQTPMNFRVRRQHANGQVVSEQTVPVLWSAQQFAWKYSFWQVFFGRQQATFNGTIDGKIDDIISYVSVRWPSA